VNAVAECDYCKLIERGNLIFDDKNVVVAISPSQAGLGHVLVIPKEHFTILEQIPDFIAGHMFSIANNISTAIFETLRAHGTNIIIENGVSAGQRIAHFAINVVPRSENDGLGFNWLPKRLSDDEMSTSELQLKEHAKNIGAFEKEKKTITFDEKQESIPDSDEDYTLRQLRRIP